MVAMANGHFLKSHRDLDGQKAYQLHPLHGSAEIIPAQVVVSLQNHGLIDSNKKFPVATFWLTPKGDAISHQLDKR